MDSKKVKCFMQLKGKTCIKKTSPNPGDVECEKCLWNLRGKEEDARALESMERLYSRYRKKTS